MICRGTPKAKAASWRTPDPETRKRGDKKGLDTKVSPPMATSECKLGYMLESPAVSGTTSERGENMGKFIFEFWGLEKTTKMPVTVIGKFRGSIERTKREINCRAEKFKQKHESVVVTGPVDILDPKFFKVIKSGITKTSKKVSDADNQQGRSHKGVKKQIEEAAQETGGEALVMSSKEVNFQDLVAFQHGTQEESDAAFERLKSMM